MGLTGVVDVCPCGRPTEHYDLIFLNRDWARETRRLLDKGARFVQPFDTAEYLAPDQDCKPLGEGHGATRTHLFQEQSCASCFAAGIYFNRSREITRVEAERGLRRDQLPPIAHGMAWAARREAVRRRLRAGDPAASMARKLSTAR